ncbi:uncharacterized protein LOC108671173 [Hyalella azteca]|uniref:Uncharacterized protein LOC108671173 n=1 Tax=Hyalella azteca TaxID=294128 RepID=A0A8B7NKH4_HYAAZ|nr:uncharacterized protein LOC108671173 [Hyalella azteca]XP_018014157.1 uncharacterized protein LOC108671173 [Hyalella azteca]XP_018014158.1 uncharacterized protein LOC108671173 [Hyalella azteca]
MKKNIFFLNGRSGNRCTNEQECHAACCDGGNSASHCSTSAVQDTNINLKNSEKINIASDSTGSTNVSVHMRKNNVQLQLKKLGTEGRWSVEENSLIVDENPSMMGNICPNSPTSSQSLQEKHVNIKPNFFYGSVSPNVEKHISMCNGNSSVPKTLCNSLGKDLVETDLQQNIQHNSHSVVMKNLNGTSQVFNNNLTQQRNSLSNGSDFPKCPSLVYKNVLSEEEADNPCQLSIRTKNNNNVGVVDKPSLVKDGMDEYFKEYKVIPADGTNGEGDTADLPDLLQVDQQSESNDHSKPLPTTTVTTATIAGGTTREIRAYKDDQLNLLNGDDYEDEDECIYTYKEGSGFDDVLVRHLLTTCISCGLPNYRPEGDIDASSSINPLNIGGNTHKEHPQQENESLFSPDMDFLEMDFDPGSTAEDAESSDCDDNCYPGIKMLATPNACSAPGSSCKVAAAKSNVGTFPIVNGHVGSDAQIDKFSSVLCRRCESDPSIVNKVVNNARGNIKSCGQPTSNSLSNDSNNFTGMYDRPSISQASSGAVPKKIDNIKILKEFEGNSTNIELRNDASIPPSVIHSIVLIDNLLPSSSCKSISVDNSRNLKQNIIDGNNIAVDSCQAVSDSEQDTIKKNFSSNQLMNITDGVQASDNNFTASSGVSYIHSHSFESSQSNTYDLESRLSHASMEPRKIVKNCSALPSAWNCTTSNGRHNNMNKEFPASVNNDNNLGCFSAPEVSPAHEYSPQQAFKRSISFHNQLSSPKCENVCCYRSQSMTESPSSPRNQTQPLNNSSINLRLQNNGNLRPLPHRHTCFEFSGIPISQINSLQSYDSTHSHNTSHVCHGDPTQPSNPLQLHGEARTRNGDAHISPGALNLPRLDLLSTKRSKGVDSNDASTPAPHKIALTEDNLASSPNKSAAEDRFTSRQTSVFNISPCTSKLPQEILPQCEDLSSSSGAGGDGGDFEGEKFSSWVVKGSLPPKISDPSIDVNTTPSTVNARDDSCPRVLQKTMVWTERQATARQVLQLQRSACGLSAVANVLLALDQHIPPSALGRHVVPRCRAEAAPLVDYLLSRACAGTTHADLIDGMTRATNGSVVAHFFHMFPKRAVQLSRWLASWISKGGVAVCTLNLQRGVSAGQTIPDAWHHQMVFGVGPQGVYLTNPVECVSEERLSEQLCSERVLLVRRDDIVRHWDPSQALHALLQQQDQRWRDMNVLGQVSLVLKEQQCSARRSGCSQQRGRERLTSHVGIPAAYHSGVTVFMRSDNSHAHELLNAPDLPLLE